MPVDGYQDYRRQLGKTFRALREEIPDVMSGFAALHSAAMSEGALDVKTKELMAVGIGIGARCEGCLASHVHAASRAGATRAELMETIGVAIMMSGGPGTIYAVEAYKAVEELAVASR